MLSLNLQSIDSQNVLVIGLRQAQTDKIGLLVHSFVAVNCQLKTIHWLTVH